MTKGSDPDSPGPPRRLEALAAQARKRALRTEAELERRRGQPVGLGDLFVLPATADLPVEWAVLERRPEGGGKLLVVPADTNPLAGAADIEVGEEDPGGPLSLRCRFGVWLDTSRFEPELRSGVLSPEAVAEALQRHREIESGSLAPSPLAEEVDADPEYREWIRDVPECAAALAVAASRSVVKRFPSSSWGPAHALAAALALVAIGLSFWVLQLRSEVDRLSAPVFDLPSVQVDLGQDVRGGTTLRVPQDASHVLLVLVLDPSLGLEPREGYLEILRQSGEPVWRSSRVRLPPPSDFKLILARRLLPNGDYRVRVYPESGFSAQPLTEELLRVETAE
jgi:hypothetical protein